MSERTYKLYAVKLSAIDTDQLKEFEFSLVANSRYALVYTDKTLNPPFVEIAKDVKIEPEEQQWRDKCEVQAILQDNVRYLEEHKEEILPELDNWLTNLEKALAEEQKKIGEKK